MKKVHLFIEVAGGDINVINVMARRQPSTKRLKLFFPSLKRKMACVSQLVIIQLAQRDEIRWRYLKAGPFQPKLSKYLGTEVRDQHRRFQYAWYKQFSWLEYSLSKDKAYCFSCFIIETRSSYALVNEGFNNWKRFNNGEKCVFLVHVESVASSHNNCGCAFRGHDESPQSLNQGNFIEMLQMMAALNEDIAKVVLDNVPQNSKYTNPQIQKEILNILANKVRTMIREEIGYASFCILVDEAQDESKREQMAIVLRFVNRKGILIEHFFDRQFELSNILTKYNLHVHMMHGQGYDGASNMQGVWNGLQELFLKDCPYAYYVHCFAYRLQLALVAVAKEMPCIWQFFSHLTFVVNLVVSSPKRISELQYAQRDEIAIMLASGERQSGRGANQMSSLQRAGATRWSSHYDSARSLLEMYGASCKVLENLSKNGAFDSIRGETSGVYVAITTFEFIFVFHLIDKIMGITNVLCQALQHKSLDILNALRLISTMKTLLSKLRKDGWDTFFERVKLFCGQHDIDILDMGGCYRVRHSCQRQDPITVEHHYHFDVFNEVIDFQLMELNSIFNEKSIELLTLSSALDPMLTLPASTTSTERAFSAMKLVKTTLRNKTDDEFLADCMVLYIKRELVEKVNLDSVIDDFYSLKSRRAQLQ
ncbi:zinc finger MYM-type protein 1-like [Tripterygium wilfordii]|uniref:zinc finger MYM-type protein 1-like n=1 Tax=Tripterygium wilfordii TaxID=458696 RepID=UPI0018F8122C|nr:zinc finger MYM-type protein 1-like [Tripterygium wilfordii]